MEYKSTLNLPETDFPMKANLKVKELEQLQEWEESDLYGKIRKEFSGKPKFVFHDGPPYANGHIHMGHALNKILKDFIVRIMTMKGYDASFIPGWDCHGLPIEHQVGKELGKNKKDYDKNGIRKLCREYAAKFVDIQREEFKRLGISARWDKPYLTMDYGYEAAIVKEFGKFVESGQVYKGLKPVHWCVSCRTALAEAEVEYADHKSPSIYVKFPLISDISNLFPDIKGEPVSIVIWTTTPWTLPANLAVCVHSDFEYVAAKWNGENIVLAKDLLPALSDAWDSELKIVGECLGKDLENFVSRHPFAERDSKVILGEHVTLEQGTGCVHTAPGHGQDDYIVGLKYGLDVYNPVDDCGIFKEDVLFFAGQFVTKANPDIIKKLEEDGFLIKHEDIKHSYPHCWRCHQPIIFRATAQWFIPMDSKGLRQKSLDAIRQTKWIPPWGEERIYKMVENRPDWCVSRQRAWGTPITIISCDSCGTFLDSKAIMDHIVELIEKNGADYWFIAEPEELLPVGTACPKCNGSLFVKENDILDVWFDSGVSHAAVLERDEEGDWPADLYLEGSDQHRGWFHSSLLESIGTRGKPPYKSVLTHGYVVDGKGKKMSKSSGNVIAPQKIIDQYGAEILRLWVASENYREDIRVSNEILKRLTEAYRKIRNTFRYLLGNLSDFDTEEDLVIFNEMLEIDRFILDRFKKLSNKILKAYEDYEFHVFYHAFYNFCIVDLSAFYLDILKDRLYTYPKDSKERRSGQTALHCLLLGMTRLMAPILSFTAEEIWKYLPKGSAEEDSVHMSSFAQLEYIDFPENLAGKWERIIALKGEVSKALELSRRAKTIGHALDATVKLALPEELKNILKDDLEELKFIFIVSKVDIVDNLNEESVYSSDKIDGLKVFVAAAPGDKCERCWNYFEPYNNRPEHLGICSRCSENLVSVKA
jgi:isoleucyl-tRNA synthetase